MTDEPQGKIMTLAEAFKLREQELREEADRFDAWRATPEGKAREAHHRRMSDADTRFAEEKPSVEDEEDGEMENGE